MIKGESLAVIAKETGVKLETTNAITRTTSPPGLTASGVQQAFALPKGAASSALTADGKSRTVFKVAEIMIPAEATQEQAGKIKDELTRVMQADTLNTYVAGLGQRYVTSVNQAALTQLLGGDQTGQ